TAALLSRPTAQPSPSLTALARGLAASLFGGLRVVDKDGHITSYGKDPSGGPLLRHDGNTYAPTTAEPKSEAGKTETKPEAGSVEAKPEAGKAEAKPAAEPVPAVEPKPAPTAQPQPQ
ncbi:hypothetical protein ADK38_16855, partial [Streptomyces varsoviensis]